MSRKPAKAASFLSALNLESVLEPEATPVTMASTPPRPTTVATAAVAKRQGRPKRAGVSRADLKHIGGYLADDAAERFARLKIRTKLGNDELMTLAINELWRIEGAKRKWED